MDSTQRARQDEFAKRFYQIARGVVVDLFLARVVTAQAILESGWGEEYPPVSNNPLGIKPHNATVPYTLFRGSKIRIFESYSACVGSWLYLVYKSTHPEYVAARRALAEGTRSLALDINTGGKAWPLYLAWFHEFLRGYCPGNVEQYFDSVKSILRRIEPLVKEL